MKYTHLQLKNMIMQEDKFRRLVQTDLYRNAYLFISLALSTLIKSDDASIRRRVVVNECGAYSRAALFNIFALTCGA